MEEKTTARNAEDEIGRGSDGFKLYPLCYGSLYVYALIGLESN